MNKQIISAFGLVLATLCCRYPAAAQEPEPSQNVAEPDTEEHKQGLDKEEKADEPETNQSAQAMAKDSQQSKASPPKPSEGWQWALKRDQQDDERKETLFLELGIGFGRTDDDGFIERMNLFGYQKSEDNVFRYNMAAGYTVLPYLCLMGQFANLDDVEYDRPGEVGHVFRWSTHAAAIAVRGQFPPLESFRLFAQVASGLAFAQTEFLRKELDSPTETMEESFLGFYLDGSIGMMLLLEKLMGFFLQFGLRYAPVVENELGDVRNGIEFVTIVGLRFSDRGF